MNCLRFNRCARGPDCGNLRGKTRLQGEKFLVNFLLRDGEDDGRRGRARNLNRHAVNNAFRNDAPRARRGRGDNARLALRAFAALPGNEHKRASERAQRLRRARGGAGDAPVNILREPLKRAARALAKGERGIRGIVCTLMPKRDERASGLPNKAVCLPHKRSGGATKCCFRAGRTLDPILRARAGHYFCIKECTSSVRKRSPRAPA